MKKRLLTFSILIFFLFSCKKDKSVAVENFARGDLFLGITNDADTKTVFDTLNKLNFKIDKMFGFYFNANLPADSLKSLLTFLNTKSYIKNGNGFSASGYYYEPEKVIRVLCTYFDMNIANQSDFLHTVDSLKWVEKHAEKYMFIKIPEGSEKFWLEEFKKYPFIKWTELNSISQIDPY